jgi:hypothetical protein
MLFVFLSSICSPEDYIFLVNSTHLFCFLAILPVLTLTRCDSGLMNQLTFTPSTSNINIFPLYCLIVNTYEQLKFIRQKPCKKGRSKPNLWNPSVNKLCLKTSFSPNTPWNLSKKQCDQTEARRKQIYFSLATCMENSFVSHKLFLLWSLCLRAFAYPIKIIHKWRKKDRMTIIANLFFLH